MKLTLESLYKDHDHLRRILYLLEHLLIDIYRGSSQDYPMLLRILAYIQDYPERVHHPAEDAMLSVMLDNSAGDKKFRENINTIMKDHSEIEGITRDTIEAVESMLANTSPDITSIGNKIATLINRQRSHLLFEEMNIYPHITKYLNSEDPIFGDKIKKGYEDIFKAL